MCVWVIVNFTLPDALSSAVVSVYTAVHSEIGNHSVHAGLKRLTRATFSYAMVTCEI